MSYRRRPRPLIPASNCTWVCDNYATQKHLAVKAWLKENPRVTLHFTSAGCSWLNMVQMFLGIITRRAIHRGTGCQSKT